MELKIQVGDESKVFYLDRPSFCSLDSALFCPLSAPLFRQSLNMNFLKGLAKIPEDGVLRTVSAKVLHMELSQVYEELKHYEDLLNKKYLYEFSDSKGELGSGGRSGFSVNGLYGFINTRPTGYCTLTLSESSPIGGGRPVQIIDMRVKKEIETDDRGTLKIRTRKFNNLLFEFFPKSIEFLNTVSGEAKIIALD